MACTTRETVTRTLGQFRKEGWISIEDSLVTFTSPSGCKHSARIFYTLALPKAFRPSPRAIIGRKGIGQGTGLSPKAVGSTATDP